MIFFLLVIKYYYCNEYKKFFDKSELSFKMDLI